MEANVERNFYYESRNVFSHDMNCKVWLETDGIIEKVTVYSHVDEEERRGIINCVHF